MNNNKIQNNDQLLEAIDNANSAAASTIEVVANTQMVLNKAVALVDTMTSISDSASGNTDIFDAKIKEIDASIITSNEASSAAAANAELARTASITANKAATDANEAVKDVCSKVDNIQSNVNSQLQQQDIDFQQKSVIEFEKNKNYVDGKSIEIAPLSILPESLSESTKQYIEGSGGGTITNLADDEDLVSQSNVLKFKDKAYQPSNFSGLGRKILRKNIDKLSGKNILTQSMINLPNTIYEIQYDYDLGGATINIPEGCTLNFAGGSFENGKISGNPTVESCGACFKTGLVVDRIKNIDVFARWFFNEEEQLKRIVELSGSSNSKLHLTNTTYNIRQDMSFSENNYDIIGNGAVLNIISPRLIFGNSSGTYTKKISIKDIKVQGNNVNTSGIMIISYNQAIIENVCILNMGTAGEIGVSSGIYARANTLIVNNCVIDTCNTSGIYNGGANTFVYNTKISNCKRFGVVTGGEFNIKPLEIIHYEGNMIIKCGGGLHCESPSIEKEGTMNVINNTILDCGGNDADLNAITAGRWINCMITGNIIRNYAINSDNPTFAINAVLAQNSIIQNNIIENSALGIYINGFAKNRKNGIKIVNNILLSITKIGINLSECTGINSAIISNNDISLQREATGIRVYQSNKCYIHDNLIIAEGVDNIGIWSDSVVLDIVDNSFKGDFSLNLDISAIRIKTFNTIKQIERMKTPFFIGGISKVNGKTTFYGDELPIGFALKIGDEVVKTNGVIMVAQTESESPRFAYRNHLEYTPTTRGISSERPVLTPSDWGAQYYDKTLKKYVCWDGTTWINLDGTAL